MSSPLRAALAVALVAVSAASADSVRLLGASQRTAQRFADAAALEDAGRWAEAVDLYLRVADESGDDLVPAAVDGRHLVPARALMQRRVAARRELLGPYRERLETRTRKALDAADPLDATALERIVATAFCTRAAAEALNRLGDLACERGDFATARRSWKLLQPPSRAGELVHPDPPGDLALGRAKTILAHMLAGETADARTELDMFRRDHATSTGYFAGREGNLLATLQQLLDAPTTRIVGTDARPPQPTTFAMNPSRNAVLTGRLPPYAPEPRYPPIALHEVPRTEERLAQRPIMKPAALAYHPVVLNRKILVADAMGVTAYDLDTGTSVSRFGLNRGQTRWPTSEARHTVSVSGDRVYARLGQPRIRSERADAESELVCLTLQSDGRLKHRWTLPASKPDAALVSVWEGTPIVRDGRMFAAITRLDGNRAVTAVFCFDPSDPQPSLLWQQDVFEAAADTAERTQHLLLTLTGPLVVCGPHAGVVVALDAATGKHAWAVRYATIPVKDSPADAPFRELGPCVARDGVLYAAPADSDRVYAWDASTGTSVWESDRISLCHLLGATRGLVVGQRGGSTGGLSALDTSTGRLLPHWGYSVFGSDPIAPFGRGLLAEDRVYWPTRAAGVRELRLDGEVEYPPTSFLSLPGGNLAYGDGGLIVAAEDRLHVLLPPNVEGDAPAAKVGRGNESIAIEKRRPIVAGEHEDEPQGTFTDFATEGGRPQVEGRIRLDAGRETAYLGDGANRRVFVVSSDSLAQRDFPDGREVWKRPLPFAPIMVQASRDNLWVAGERNIAAINNDGRLYWHMRVADAASPVTAGWRDRFFAPSSRQTLSGFRIRGPLSFAWLGHRRLLCFGGATMTQATTVAGQLRPGAAFHPNYMAGGDAVVVQTTDGRRIVFDAETGRQVSESAAPREPWPALPSADDNWLLVYPEEQRLVAYDTIVGKPLWTRDYPNWPSLTGEVPQLRHVGGDLLVALRRNDGTEIERLDPKTGQPRSNDILVVPGDSFDVAGAVPADEAIVVAVDGKLIGYKAGRRLWRIPLVTAGPWRLEVGGEGLIVGWPIPSPAAAPFAKWPVMAVSATDGRVVKRWEFGRPGPKPAVLVANGMLTVASEDEVRRVKLPTARGAK